MEKRKVNQLAVLAIAVLLVLSAILTAINIMQYNQRLHEAEKLEAERDKLARQVEQMRYRLDSPMDDEYIAKIAREKLGLCYPDEIIFYGDIGK